jgi:cytochrome P450
LRTEVLADPYPSYRQLRDDAPILWDRRFGWLVFRYDDVAAGLRDPRLSARRPGPNDPIPRILQPVADEIRYVRAVQGQWLLCADPPRHTRLRSALSPAFSPRSVEHLQDRIESLVAELLDRVADQGHFDVIADLAYPLPATIIAELLGVPLDDLDQFKHWSDDIAESFTLSPETMHRAHDALRELTAYVADLRTSPTDCGALRAAGGTHDGADALDHGELVAQSVMLLFAGHETTTNLIGNGILALLRHPGQLERLQREPDLMGTAIEELLRFDSPTQATFRSVGEDFELRGQRLGKGDPVLLMLGSANRDPCQFIDPDMLDITRADNRHLAFSQGPHFCLGAALARMEGQIAIQRTIERFPKLDLAGDSLAWRPNVFLRGLESLHVTI